MAPGRARGAKPGENETRIHMAGACSCLRADLSARAAGVGGSLGEGDRKNRDGLR